MQCVLRDATKEAWSTAVARTGCHGHAPLVVRVYPLSRAYSGTLDPSRDAATTPVSSMYAEKVPRPKSALRSGVNEVTSWYSGMLVPVATGGHAFSPGASAHTVSGVCFAYVAHLPAGQRLLGHVSTASETTDPTPHLTNGREKVSEWVARSGGCYMPSPDRTALSAAVSRLAVDVLVRAEKDGSSPHATVMLHGHTVLSNHAQSHVGI